MDSTYSTDLYDSRPRTSKYDICIEYHISSDQPQLSWNHHLQYFVALGLYFMPGND